jgi:hypothetical protein
MDVNDELSESSLRSESKETDRARFFGLLSGLLARVSSAGELVDIIVLKKTYCPYLSRLILDQKSRITICSGTWYRSP